MLIFLAGAGIFTAVLHSYDLDWATSLIDGSVSSALLVLTCWAGIMAINNYPTGVGILAYALLMGIAAGTLSWYLDKLVLNWWFFTDAAYIRIFNHSQFPRLLIFMLTSCWLLSLAATQKRNAAFEEQFKNIADASKLHREAELFKLRQQLQPHFLYNSLNSISALILIEPEKAQEMIGKLSDFLRNSVKREGREQIPVAEELEYIDTYLAIESIRFGDRLRINYDEHCSREGLMPPFLLQPILENAIKFGLYGRTGKVDIHIGILCDPDYLSITINNPYDAENSPPKGTGFGLEGIQRRLYLLYGRTDLLATRTEDGIFFTTLKIPQTHV